MARNSFLSNFLTIVFTLFEGKNTHLKSDQTAKSRVSCLARGRGGVPSSLPKRCGRARLGDEGALNRMSRGWLGAGFSAGRNPQGFVSGGGEPLAVAFRCQGCAGARAPAMLRRAPTSPGVGSGVCHRPRPFHTRHPVGNIVIFTPRGLAGLAVPLKCFLWGVYRPF